METAGASLPDDAQRILDVARSPDHPREWFVWPLRREVITRALAGWAVTGVIGLLMFVPALLVTVPSNFQHGSGLAVFTIVLLVILGLIGFGGLALCGADIMRLVQADRFLLVMTPDDFVKQTPHRTIHVPMTAVAYVTLKGVRPPPNPNAETAFAQTMVMMRRYTGIMGVPGTSRREFRRPPTLAFLDRRSQREVLVATDDSFDQLAVLEEILNLYAGGRSRARSGAR